MDCFSCFKDVGQQKSDYGWGFSLFGCLRQLFTFLCLFLLFNFGLKVLQLGNHLKVLTQQFFYFRGKSSGLSTGPGKYSTIVSFGSRGKSSDLGNGLCSKPCGVLEFWRNSEPIGDQLEENNGVEKRNGDYIKEKFGSNWEANGDDEVDVMRELVKIERRRADAAYLELDKERTAAATASEEVMAMILRLQNEKSLIEMEAKQYRRLAEEKQIHDQEVIKSLRWIVMKHESERSLLEDQLSYFRRKSKVCVKGDGGDESEAFDESLNFFNSNMEESPGDALISSRDIDMSPRGKHDGVIG